ncbi:MAG: TerB family tellurite resistance protein [Bacteroidales bacterium]|nr:TerB family tellurite resistance protein [Bacteroidales bacterium]
MAKYGKWIGGGLGWAMGGPIGAVLGFVFGTMYDSMQSAEFEYRPPLTGQENDQSKPWSGRPQTQTGDFTVSLLMLSASVMKADNRVLKSELEYVRNFLIVQFGEKAAAQQLLLLREILKQNYHLSDVAQQVGRFMDYSSKLQLLHYLFGIAQADSKATTEESALIEQISIHMRVTKADFDSIKAMFIKDNFNNYKILEITPDASDEEIKKAYRQMALKYHPDRLSHLGPEVQQSAKEKFQELNAAYNAIKAERGMA